VGRGLGSFEEEKQVRRNRRNGWVLCSSCFISWLDLLISLTSPSPQTPSNHHRRPVPLTPKPPHPPTHARTHARTHAQIIQGEVAAGVPSEKIVLGGFSQGGAVTLHVSLRSTTRLAGPLVWLCLCSCWGFVCVLVGWVFGRLVGWLVFFLGGGGAHFKANHTKPGAVILSGWLPLKSEYPAEVTEVGKSMSYFHGCVCR
jgi:hypothetical protein